MPFFRFKSKKSPPKLQTTDSIESGENSSSSTSTLVCSELDLSYKDIPKIVKIVRILEPDEEYEAPSIKKEKRFEAVTVGKHPWTKPNHRRSERPSSMATRSIAQTLADAGGVTRLKRRSLMANSSLDGYQSSYESSQRPSTPSSIASSGTNFTARHKEIARGFEQRVAQLPPLPPKTPNVKLKLCHSKDGVRPTFQVISTKPRRSRKSPRVPQRVEEVSIEA